MSPWLNFCPHDPPLDCDGSPRLPSVGQRAGSWEIPSFQAVHAWCLGNIVFKSLSHIREELGYRLEEMMRACRAACWTKLIKGHSTAAQNESKGTQIKGLSTEMLNTVWFVAHKVQGRGGGRGRRRRHHICCATISATYIQKFAPLSSRNGALY